MVILTSKATDVRLIKESRGSLFASFRVKLINYSPEIELLVLDKS